VRRGLLEMKSVQVCLAGRNSRMGEANSGLYDLYVALV
jgi:hypothetical protein